jgi:hypothetical protein
MGAAKQFVHVFNNTTQLYEFTAGVGEGRLDFKPGTWSKTPSAALDRITGGFDRNGKAKGGTASRYFNDSIEVEPGKFRPVLHIGKPAPGEAVHEIAELPGVRSHYRMTKQREQEKVIADLQLKLAELAGQISAGGKVAPAVASEVDLTGLELDDVKAAIKGLDTAALKQALGAEVAGEDRPTVVKLLKARIKAAKK